MFVSFFWSESISKNCHLFPRHGATHVEGYVEHPALRFAHDADEQDFLHVMLQTRALSRFFEVALSAELCLEGKFRCGNISLYAP